MKARQFNVGIILPDQEPMTPYPITSDEANLFNEHIRSRMMSINTTYAPMIREHYEVAPNIPIILHFSSNRNGIPFTDGDVSIHDTIHAYVAIMKNGKIQFAPPVPFYGDDSRSRWFWVDNTMHNALPVKNVAVMAWMLDFKDEYLKDPRSDDLPDKTAPDYKEKKRAKMVYGEEFCKKQGDKFRDGIRGYYGIHPDTKITFACSAILPGSDHDAHSSVLGDIFVITNGDDIVYGPVIAAYHNREIKCEEEEWWKAKAAE